MRNGHTVQTGNSRYLKIFRSKKFVLCGAAAVLTVCIFAIIDSHRIHPAPEADNPRCTRITSLAPEQVSGKTRDWTIGKGVAAWGSGAAVLRCGVDELPPNINLCVSVDGIDWVLDEKTLEEKGVSILRTYGRSPAVELTYSGPREEVGGILASLNAAIDWIPQDEECIGSSDIS
ncbi:DUF3515 family protein [Streptomyces sp. NPDC020330]|uniref:DUF3515 family protein n=1 Tax=unclassified Streptomyces TaxID=2593676 RepID=UPI0037896331